jgi:hypothetical protein
VGSGAEHGAEPGEDLCKKDITHDKSCQLLDLTISEADGRQGWNAQSIFMG